ncbi:hypothetical protein, partial [Legionella longbeachae]|uniref:hypothetical protein n=1 Tax=Legionella longbeachae TaxID=450 RepID=UPI00399D0704
MQEEDLIDHRFQPVGWSDRQFATTTLSGDAKKYIYFAGAEDGPVKIGISKNPWARLKDFQNASADKL